MNLKKVIDASLVDFLNETYDVAIFSSGYEKRAGYAATLFSNNNIKNIVVIGFDNLKECFCRRENDDYFLKAWGASPINTSAGDDFVVQQELNKINFESTTIRILIDYSSMSRLWYVGLLNWAKSKSCFTVVIDFIYSSGVYDELTNSAVIDNIVSLPGCEGGPIRAPHSLAIFGLGFHGWASLCVLEQLEADDVISFIASPGSVENYPSLVKEKNADFFSEPRVSKEILCFPLKSVESTYRCLSEIVVSHLESDSVTLVPMGPKPHVLASMLVAFRFKEITCMRVNFTDDAVLNVRPTGDVICTRVLFA